MGVNERKEREKTELRELILEAATHVFVHEGYEKTSIRSIAERIEYSAGTIYNYFKDKNEILFAIHEQAFEKFLAVLSSVSDVENPLERIRQMGYLYLKFVFENQELYDLMFIDYAPMDCIKENAASWECGMQNHILLRNSVAECLEKGLIRPMDIDLATFMIWSQMHGMASLVIRDRLSMFEKDAIKPMLNAVIEQMLALYKI